MTESGCEHHASRFYQAAFLQRILKTLTWSSLFKCHVSVMWEHEKLHHTCSCLIGVKQASFAFTQHCWNSAVWSCDTQLPDVVP